jgi:CRISPR-associated endonuclease Cas2
MSVRQYWIAYDIGDNRERTRVERCLSRYGQRLQKSVFHCVLDGERLGRLKGELEALACRSGNIVLAALAEPAQMFGTDKPAAVLVENWAFTFFESDPDNSSGSIENLEKNVLLSARKL